MFFKVSLVKELLVEPKEMGKHVRSRATELLRKAVEGKLVGNHGFVISVLEVEDIGKGVVDNSMGSAVYKIKYRALVFSSFEKEILDCTVVSCNPHGIQCSLAGMVDAFVHRSQLPEDISQFINGAWVSDNGDLKIRANCGLRLRVLTQRFESFKISVVGTINDSYCGLLFNEPEETAMDEEETESEVVASSTSPPPKARLAEEEDGSRKKLHLSNHVSNTNSFNQEVVEEDANPIHQEANED
ncbi:hypothetical protein BASA81_000779 [Batrachochytrium salamandrivorans]|nr:hypothetical protein BASA81_000779 [Batrachochytrium salamandrivorans]